MSSDRSSSPSMSQENLPPHITVTNTFNTAPVPGSYPNTWPYTVGFNADTVNVQIHNHAPTIAARLTPQPRSRRPGKRAASNENIASMTTMSNKRHISVGSTPSAEDRVLQAKPAVEANNLQNIMPSAAQVGTKPVIHQNQLHPQTYMPIQKARSVSNSDSDSDSEDDEPDSAQLLASIAMLKNKRHGSTTPSPEERALQAKILSKARHVENFGVFQSAEDHAKDLLLASRDEKPSKADLDMLLESIPLEDRAGGESNLTETALVSPL